MADDVAHTFRARYAREITHMTATNDDHISAGRAEMHRQIEAKLLVYRAMMRHWGGRLMSPQKGGRECRTKPGDTGSSAARKDGRSATAAPRVPVPVAASPCIASHADRSTDCSVSGGVGSD